MCDYRQWTLSFPYALRYRLIRDGKLFGRVIGVFVRTVFSWQKRAAKANGLTNVHCGSVSLVQRYGSVIQLHPHTHTWIPDGVFAAEDDGTLRFCALPPPTDGDVTKLCARICQRVMRLSEGQDDEPLDQDDDAVMAQAQADAIHPPLSRPLWLDETAEPVRQSGSVSALHGGFSLHAALMVKANARPTLERLLRYGSRPPFAQRRLSVLPSGKVRLKLRKPYYTGQTEIQFEPAVFLRRLFSTLPPPRWHCSRYHGIFSSHHKLRPQLKALVPQVKAPATQCASTDALAVEPEVLAEHRRPTYAALLSRVFPQDLGSCTRCGGKLRLIACIDDTKAITKILKHLGLQTVPPTAAPARSPPQLRFDDFDLIDTNDCHQSTYLN